MLSIRKKEFTAIKQQLIAGTLFFILQWSYKKRKRRTLWNTRIYLHLSKLVLLQ